MAKTIFPFDINAAPLEKPARLSRQAVCPAAAPSTSNRARQTFTLTHQVGVNLVLPSRHLDRESENGYRQGLLGLRVTLLMNSRAEVKVPRQAPYTDQFILTRCVS